MPALTLLAAVACAPTTATSMAPEARSAFASEPARGVLSRHYIEVSGDESMEVPFTELTRLLARPDALGRLISAYLRHLPDPQHTSASLACDGPGVYRYNTEDGEPTEVRELFCGAGEGGGIEAVYFSHGHRFIGEFSALIRLVAWPDGARMRYRLWVYAYPHNALVRLAARSFGIAGRFFRSRTGEPCRLAEQIVPEAAALPAGGVIAGGPEPQVWAPTPPP